MGKVLRFCLFNLIVAAGFVLVDEIFRWKDYHYKTWPNTATVAGFYKMKRNSVDVLFFGSSQGVTAFDPQVLYDEYGLRSYNLSTEQQSIAISYYLLREALKYQEPAAIVLDVWMCYGNRNPLNSAESCVRKVVDEMRPSQIKRETVNAICRIDPTLLRQSFYLRNLRYHARWKYLREEDFAFAQLGRPMLLKGYSAESIPWRTGDFPPLCISDTIRPEAMHGNMAVYLSKIAELCRERDIPLVLVKTPNRGWNVARHISMRDFADAHGLPFYDFNEEYLYISSGYNYATDGDSHLDNTGAAKVTRSLGSILLFDYFVQPAKDEQWELSRPQARHVYTAMELPHITDIHDYLAKAKEDGFTVLMAVKDDGTAALDEDILQKLAELGVRTDLKGQYRRSFYAVAGAEGGREQLADAQLSATGTLRKGRSSYSIQSAGFHCGNDCSIKIDGREYARRRRGLNIVVYDAEYRRVVDSVCFDTCSGLQAYR